MRVARAEAPSGRPFRRRFLRRLAASARPSMRASTTALAIARRLMHILVLHVALRQTAARSSAGGSRVVATWCAYSAGMKVLPFGFEMRSSASWHTPEMYTVSWAALCARRAVTSILLANLDALARKILRRSLECDLGAAWSSSPSLASVSGLYGPIRKNRSSSLDVVNSMPELYVGAM